MVKEHALPTEGFVKLPQVLRVIPVSKSTWFRGIAAGKYPKPVKLGTRASAWRVEEVRQCIASISDQPIRITERTLKKDGTTATID